MKRIERPRSLAHMTTERIATACRRQIGEQGSEAVRRYAEEVCPTEPPGRARNRA